MRRWRNGLIFRSLTWLAVVSVLVQGLCAGVAAGSVLCIGCDRGAWKISAPCAPNAEPNCCTIDTPQTSTDSDSHGWSSGYKACDCIDVPLVKGETVSAAPPRVDFKTIVFHIASISITPPQNHELLCVACSIRAGPTTPRQLEPMSRRTVLLL